MTAIIIMLIVLIITAAVWITVLADGEARTAVIDSLLLRDLTGRW